MKATFKFLFFVAVAFSINLSLSNYSKAISKFPDLDSLENRIDAIIHCNITDTTCLDIAWGNHVINDSKVKTMDSVMNAMLVRQNKNILAIDSLGLVINDFQQEIANLKNSGTTIPQATLNSYYDTKKNKSNELTRAMVLDRVIRKIEYFFDLGTLDNVVRRP